MDGKPPQGSSKHGAVVDGNVSTDDVKMEQSELVTMESLHQMMMIQLKFMQAQVQNIANAQNPHTGPALTMKNTKVPEGRYDISVAEYRTFVKDVDGYKTLTQLSDAQIVLQLRLNMDPALKAAVVTNFQDT